MNWLRLVERYPKISIENAAVVMGVPAHRAKRELENAHRILRTPVERRLSGARSIACRQVQAPEVTVRVSTTCPSKEATRLWEKANGVTVKSHTGILRSPLSQAAIDKLPSVRVIATSDSLNCREFDVPKDLDQDPNWMRKLGKLLVEHGIAGGVVVPGDHPRSGSKRASEEPPSGGA